jgi:hypothetical protein
MARRQQRPKLTLAGKGGARFHSSPGNLAIREREFPDGSFVVEFLCIRRKIPAFIS